MIRDTVNPRYTGLSFVSLNCDKYFGNTTRTTEEWKRDEEAVSIKEERMKAVEEIRNRPMPRKKREKGPILVKEPSMKKLMTKRLKKLKEKKIIPIEEVTFDLSSPHVELALNLETGELIEISPDLNKDA